MDNQWDADAKIKAAMQEINTRITLGMRSRGYRAANELRNASQLVLRGQRSGRRYRVPGTKSHYTASAPGEPPAVRTGVFRASWQPRTNALHSGKNISVRAYIENDAKTDNGTYVLGSILQEGTSRMAPRPYQEEIQQKALKKIVKIYEEPYM